MKYFIWASILGVVAACGNNGEITTPLTEAQKQIFKATTQSTGRSFGAAKLAEGVTSNRDAIKKKAEDDAVEQKMADHLVAKSCDIKFTPMGDGIKMFTVLGAYGSVLTATGDDCPIALSLSLKIDSSGEKYSNTTDITYVVKDATYKSYNDVSGLNFKGNNDVTTSISATGGTISNRGDGEGTLISQLYGNVGLKFIGSGDMQVGASGQGEGSLVTRLQVLFPEFGAELKQSMDVQDGKATANYFLNGQPISSEEYQEYFKTMGIAPASF